MTRVVGTNAAVPLVQQDTGNGEPSLSGDEALQKAREMFPELLEGKDVNLQLQEYAGAGRQGWRLNWSVPGPGAGQSMHYNTIMLDAETGTLISCSCKSAAGTIKEGASLHTREAARQAAEDFAAKYRPAEFARTRLANDYSSYYQSGKIDYTYSFFWERLANGIPVDGDGINITVDALSGSVIGFLINWHDDAVFPQPGRMTENLEPKVLEELGLILNYQVTEGNLSGIPEAYLVYRLNSSGSLRLDPDSGAALTPEGEVAPIGEQKRFDGLPDLPANVATFGKPASTVSPAGKISAAEAREAAREFFAKLGLEGEVTRSGSGSSSNGIFFDEEWIFSLKEDSQLNAPPRHRNVGIDTRTGEVSSYHVSGYYEYGGSTGQPGDSGTTFTSEAAAAKAKEFIRLVHPEKQDQLIREKQNYAYHYYYGTDGPVQMYNFNFIRLANGIPFSPDGIRIVVSPEGEIVSYDCNWHAVRFADPGKIISREEAEKIFLEKMSLQPAYFFPREQGNPQVEKDPVLSLRLANPLENGINARTGQLVSTARVSTDNEGEGYEIPWDHWAAVPLAFIARSGLLPEKGFAPDNPVLRRDAVRVLVGITGSGYRSPGGDDKTAGFNDITPNDRDFNAIQTAVRCGMLDGTGSFKPDQPLTRETLAVWLVKALGYGEVAAMPIKMELKTTDAALVPESSRNYAAIACGLGLMQGDDEGRFRPLDQATWAELAVLATRAAPRLQAVN